MLVKGRKVQLDPRDRQDSRESRARLGTGATGPQGPAGPQGAQGPAGALGTAYAAHFNSDSEIGDWFKSENGSWRIEDGRLYVGGGVTGHLMVIGSERSFAGDMDISVEAEWIGGEDDMAFGILFNETSGSGTYGFGISENGGYLVTEWDGSGGVSSLIDWTDIPSGTLQDRNTLRVVTTGSVFQLFINGTKVNEVEDDTIPDGKVRLFVTSLQEVAFDDLSVIESTILPLTKAVAGLQVGSNSESSVEPTSSMTR